MLHYLGRFFGGAVTISLRIGWNAKRTTGLANRSVLQKDHRCDFLTKAWTSRLNAPGLVTFMPCDARATVCFSAFPIHCTSWSTLLRYMRGLFSPSINSVRQATSRAAARVYAGRASRNCLGSVV